MARKIKQFRLWARNEKLSTYTYSSEQESFIDGTKFKNYYPIYKIKIQTLPGIRFKLNSSNDYSYVNQSRVFELDLKGQMEINSIQFYRASIKEIDLTKGGYLIVDVIYDDEEV